MPGALAFFLQVFCVYWTLHFFPDEKLHGISECCTLLSDFHTSLHNQELECQSLFRVIPSRAWIGSTYQCRST